MMAYYTTAHRQLVDVTVWCVIL